MGRSRVLRYLVLCAALCGAPAAVRLIFAATGPTAPVPRDRDEPLAQPREAAPSTATWQRIRRQGLFTVSLDPDNLPYSARKGKRNGMEVELAHALGQRLGLTAKIDWINVRYETNLGKLLDGECDLVVGLPVDPRLREEDQPAAGQFLYTRPYYRTGYLIFARKKGPRISRLKALEGEQTRRVGAQAGSLADFLLGQRGYRRKLYGTQRAALEALSEGRIDYAYLWSNAAWLARTSPELDVEVVQPYELEDSREIAAAVRSGDQEFRTHLDRALSQLVQEGFIERLLSWYGVPYYPPGGPGGKEAVPRGQPPK